MKNLPKYIKIPLVLVAILIVQFLVHVIFLKPYISTWGATDEEVAITLPGDSLAPTIISTRAITIDAPREEVWLWMIQLGADRGGFFSYTLLEHMLGYVEREVDEIIPEFHDMEVGRRIPATLNPSGGIIDYCFEVVYVDPGKAFVVDNWGTVFLSELNPEQTRLVIRTNDFEENTLGSLIDRITGMPEHYIMERRMMMGIKERTEAGPNVPLSSVADNIWMLGLFLSAVLIFIRVLLSRELSCDIVNLVLGVLFLFPLMVLPPVPLYSVLMLIIASVTLAGMIYRNHSKVTTTTVL